jgi:hypothetical protein
MDAAAAEALKLFQSSAGLYPYGVLDYGTAARLDAECAAYAAGAADSAEDPQLAKAVELLRGNAAGT